MVGLLLPYLNTVILTHWGRVTHICVSKLTIIGSYNGLAPGRRQTIIWTNAGILLIGPMGTNFSETLIRIQKFSFKKMHLKMSSGKWRPSCLGLNVLKAWGRASRAQRPLTTGRVRRRFPSLRGTAWQSSGRSTWNGSRFEHIRAFYVEITNIHVVKLNMSCYNRD